MIVAGDDCIFDRELTSGVLTDVEGDGSSATVEGNAMVTQMPIRLAGLGCGLTVLMAGLASAGFESRTSGLDDPTAQTANTKNRSTSGAAFARMSLDQIQSQLLQWLARAKVDVVTATAVTALWTDKQQLQALSAEQTLDRLIDSFALADESARELVASCRSTGTHTSLNFEGARSDAFFRDHVQLYQARWLTQHRFYDEGLTILEALDPETVVDPASLFFYRAVCRLRLLKPSEAGDDITLLLNNTLDVPQRFRAVAELMLVEAGINADGLAQVARLMSDVQRRLDLGNSNEPVQKREDEVIAALDKLLEDMKKKQQQQQQGGDGGGSGRQKQPGEQGADQSTIKGSAEAGEADQKDLTENGSWGMLDKEAETQARELIRQQFPPNFLDAISRYTRKIAEQKK